MDVVRSILAGLRSLVVPWGRRFAPRIVIGGEDPIAQAINQDAAIVFYYTDDKAFFIGTNTIGDFGTFFIFNAEQAGVIAQYLAVTHHIPSGITTRMDIAQQGVEQLGLGIGCDQVIIGAGPGGITSLVEIGANQIDLGGSGSPIVRVGGRQLGFNGVIVNQTPPPATTYALAPFADIAGATAGAYVKAYDNTETELYMGLGMFSTAGGAVAQYGLNISGGFGDQTMGQVLLSAANVENAASAVVRVPGVLGGGLPAGAYTLTPRWRKPAGPGTLTITASSATLSYSAREIIQP